MNFLIISYNKIDISNFSLVKIWYAPIALILNTKKIITHSNSKETIFSPVSSPRVSSDPIIHTRFNIITKPNKSNFMASKWFLSRIDKNSTCIILKALSNRNNTSNWTSHVDFSFYLLNTRNSSVFTDFPVSVMSMFNSSTMIFIIWWPSTFFAYLNW